MKLDSINGKGSGKSGSKVYYVNHGVQIERAYTSQVANPQTEAQVAQRARFKLISQVSAAVEPVIIIPRKGIQSPRNIFVKKNMGFVYADGEGAQVSYENLQITPGSNGLPSISLRKNDILDKKMLDYGLDAPCGSEVTRVIFCFFVKGNENRLVYVRSEILETPNPQLVYRAAMEMDWFPSGADIVCLAYGMKDKNAAASTLYHNYNVQTGEDIAKLVANRRIDSSKFTFTQTRGATLFYGENETVSPGQGEVLLYLTSLRGSSVRVTIGVGQPQVITTGVVAVTRNASVTLEAVAPAAGANGSWQFKGWYLNGYQIPFRETNPITFEMIQQYDIVSDWEWEPYVVGLE